MNNNSMLKYLLIAMVCGLFSIAVCGQSNPTRIKDLMTEAQFKAAGLTKLTPAELKALDAWLEKWTTGAIKYATEQSKPAIPKGTPPSHTSPSKGSSSSLVQYQVQVSHNDELFLINDNKYEAQTYCFNVDEGDTVVFIEGSANGVCVSATFVNLRTHETCEAWCE